MVTLCGWCTKCQRFGLFKMANIGASKTKCVTGPDMLGNEESSQTYSHRGVGPDTHSPQGSQSGDGTKWVPTNSGGVPPRGFRSRHLQPCGISYSNEKPGRYIRLQRSRSPVRIPTPVEAGQDIISCEETPSGLIRSGHLHGQIRPSGSWYGHTRGLYRTLQATRWVFRTHSAQAKPIREPKNTRRPIWLQPGGSQSRHMATEKLVQIPTAKCELVSTPTVAIELDLQL